MGLADSQPLAAVNATRDALRDVLLDLMRIHSSNELFKHNGALWKFAKFFFLTNYPPPREHNANGSLSKGLARMEEGMVMTLDNLMYEGTNWSSPDGIGHSFSPRDARLIALIAQVVSVYIVEAVEEAEGIPDQGSPIPF